jgi:hypothetical protein
MWDYLTDIDVIGEAFEIAIRRWLGDSDAEVADAMKASVKLIRSC